MSTLGYYSALVFHLFPALGYNSALVFHLFPTLGYNSTLFLILGSYLALGFLIMPPLATIQPLGFPIFPTLGCYPPWACIQQVRVPRSRQIEKSHFLIIGVPGCQCVFRELESTGSQQVWSITRFYSVGFSQSRIGVKKCVFNKRTIKVCVSCC